MTSRRSTLAPAVFFPAAILIVAFVAVTVAATEATQRAMEQLQSMAISGFGWYYVLLVAAFVIFAIWIGVSRYGEITLGPDDGKPEFRLPVWFSMLFATGMGIGLVYWGAAEPLSHYVSPRPGVTGDEATLAQSAMSQTLLHWGIHAWAIYVVAGLALAYVAHRKGKPMSIRWALEPILGDRVKGWLGNLIDIVAILGTVFGVATSLGLGVMQIASGLGYLQLAEPTQGLQIALIIGITAVAAVSVASGLARGIKWLSNGNMILAGVLVVVVLILGPSLFILREWVQGLGYYLQNIVMMSFQTLAFRGDDGLEWESGWTIFYWGWWISWAPFVGVFIARISKGRTVREFVLGVLLVPVLVSTVWFAVFGGSAILQEMNAPGSMQDPVEGGVNQDTTLFQLFDTLPGGMGPVLAVVAIVLIVVFFVTSSDSGSFVVDMLANGGHQHPPVWSRLFWAVLEGAVAIALLLAGGLSALQTAAILIALPFSVIMVLMAISVAKELHREHRSIVRAEQRVRRRQLTDHVTERVTDRVVDHVADQVTEQVADQITEQVTEALTETGAIPVAPPSDGEQRERPDGGRRRPGPAG